MRDSPRNWQTTLAEGFSSSYNLLKFLQIPEHQYCQKSEAEFATRVPLNFAKLMQVGNPNDPLLLQVLSQVQEQEEHAHFSKDPLLESQTNLVSGLIHKYTGRVLLTVTGVCAINCRFCFRRHFPYAKNNPGREGWQAAFDYIANDSSIHEVILSGGDPLLATDKLIEHIFTELASISHVKTIRIHTRIPVVLPERITQNLLSILSQSRFSLVVVVHCNHPQEISPAMEKACLQLQAAGCVMLNQSVLLKNINNNIETLTLLSHKLFAFKIIPYYLHLLDATQGTQHFAVNDEQARDIFYGMQASLPGYLVPKLVREEPGKPNKTWFCISKVK